MDKIEKIRQKIEELYDGEAPKHDQQCDFSDGYFTGLSVISNFLDTLSEDPDKSLEEEVKNYFQGYWPGTETVEQCNTDLHFTPPAIIRLASHFAEWQKSQMLKDAYVESQIVEDGRIELGGEPLPCLNPIILLPYPQFKPGGKVRLIIVKED